MAATDSESDETSNVFSPLTTHILTPGSSTNPAFLIVVDGTILLLLVIFSVLFFITGGNLHFIALICITLALWASIKWYIAELRRTTASNEQGTTRNDTADTRKTD